MSSCHCDCHARSSTPQSPPPVNCVNVCAPTAASANPSASMTNFQTPPHHEDIEVVVRLLMSELAYVKTRLARVETEVVEIRDALETERRRQATPSNAESNGKEFVAGQPLLLTLLDESNESDSEQWSSDASNDSEWGLQITPREPATTTSAQKTTGKKPVRAVGRGYRRPKCSVEDCKLISHVGGRCRRHGDVHCAEPGCKNGVYAKDKFRRHGEKLLCSERGCVSLVYTNAKCWRHGRRPLCNEAGCSNGAIRQGRCRRHGGSVSCAVEGCTKVTWRFGKCFRHDREQFTW